jgi:predicted DNA-binding ribbon-helix-helix protein
MPKYTVVLLGQTFTVDARNNYQARRLTAELYKKKNKVNVQSAALRAQCSVRVSEEFDGRVRYPISAEICTPN